MNKKLFLLFTFILFVLVFSFLPAALIKAENSFVFNKTLRPGMTYAPDISELQKFLNQHGFVVSPTGAGSIGHETNYFGSKTKIATIAFQKANVLVPDGIVGPKTRLVINKIIGGIEVNNKPVKEYSVGGTVTGLFGSITLRNNGGDDLILNPGTSSFTFSKKISNNANYIVSISKNHSGQKCSITNNIGVISGVDVTSVKIVCSKSSGGSGGSSSHSSSKNITAFSILGIDGTIGTNTISLTVPYGTDLTNLTPTITTSPGTTIILGSGEARNFSNPVTYAVFGSDNSVKTYTVTVTLGAPSTDATLKSSSTIKGENVTDLGTPNATLSSVVAGSATVSLAEASDITNLSPFITLFDKTHAGATVTKVVKYANGASTTNFATDTAYSNGIVSGRDFFIVKVTAQDVTKVLYYKIEVTVMAGALACNSGAGTEIDPILVCSADELNSVRNNLSAYYKQIADIDLDISPYNTGDGWEPIGDDTNKFTGSYNGNSFKISNLYINRPTGNGIGLFSYVDGAIFLSVKLEDVNITGNSDNGLGALAGVIENSTISDSYSTGIVTGIGDGSTNVVYHNSQIGGLFGVVGDTSTISNCYSTSVVVSSNSASEGSYVGGLAGGHWSGSLITNSYATGSVNSTNSVGAGYSGGLVGGMSDVSTSISDSYATGAVTGSSAGWTNDLGGLVGVGWNGSYSISNSYATGTVTNNGGSNDTLGGLVARNSGSISGSYSTSTVTNDSNHAGGLVGYNTGSISNSYTTGSVTNTSSTGYCTGGLVGVNDNGGSISNTYSTSVVSGGSDCVTGGLVGLNSGAVPLYLIAIQ